MFSFNTDRFSSTDKWVIIVIHLKEALSRKLLDKIGLTEKYNMITMAFVV